MANFDQFFKELKKGSVEIAKREASDFVKEATSDGNAFLDSVKADLKTWTKQLATGKLTKEDFEFLVKGKKDLAKMEALTQAGLAAIRVERIRVAMIDLVITAAGELV
ncbi:MAG TPA: hypothetical protein VGQ60_06240 [Nitrospiraceae bacterium]|jgi:hypothetical protein|nr:hypothetical protein [Nitrospiraceae bacterium]